ncbi:MAG: hypothetical protein IJ600_08240 [Lachnospiraceae bacterium]|nr:hypothetical protein [Lachnospiraceae bacterium]
MEIFTDNELAAVRIRKGSDSCVLVGRSVRRFPDEDRYRDMQKHFHENDLLLMQFGHNDTDKDMMM